MVHDNLYLGTFLHNWLRLLGNEGYRNNLMILLCHFLKVELLLYMIFDHLRYFLISSISFCCIHILLLFQLRTIFRKNISQKVYLVQANPTKYRFHNSTVLIEGSFANADFELY